MTNFILHLKFVLFMRRYLLKNILLHHHIICPSFLQYFSFLSNKMNLIVTCLYQSVHKFLRLI